MDINVLTEEHKGFRKKYWNYYIDLERELIGISSYVALRNENWKTCSNKIISLLLNIGAEFDFLCKIVCGFNVSERKNISDYANVLLNEIRNLQQVKIEILDTDIVIYPFKNWDIQHAKDLFWWEAYNSVKHDRVDNFDKGNLENLINALGALYYLEMYYIKKLADLQNIPNVIDLPVSRSKVFKIVGWVTKYTCIGYNTYIDYMPEV